MKIIRSIAGIFVGVLVATILVGIIETLSGMFVYPPPANMTQQEFMEAMKQGTPEVKKWIQEVPVSAMALVQVAWALGALGGGFVAAWIAGRARVIHAAVVGAFILAATIFNFIMIKQKLDYVHPDWLLITGLLLPLPLSMLGGKLADWIFPQAAPPESADAGVGHGAAPPSTN